MCVGVWVCGGGCVGVGVGGARPKVKTKKLRFFRIYLKKIDFFGQIPLVP